MSIFSLSITNSRTAGSISPHLVPITRPSSGVNPIDVSTHLPFLTAVILEPLPRWQDIKLTSDKSFPSNFAASSVTNW